MGWVSFFWFKLLVWILEAGFDLIMSTDFLMLSDWSRLLVWSSDFSFFLGDLWLFLGLLWLLFDLSRFLCLVNDLDRSDLDDLGSLVGFLDFDFGLRVLLCSTMSQFLKKLFFFDVRASEAVRQGWVVTKFVKKKMIMIWMRLSLKLNDCSWIVNGNQF